MEQSGQSNQKEHRRARAHLKLSLSHKVLGIGPGSKKGKKNCKKEVRKKSTLQE